MRKLSLTLGCVVLFALSAVNAKASVILDFESFASAGNGFTSLPSPLVTMGYRFVGNQNGNDYAFRQTESANFAGSTAITGFSNETHVLSRLDGVGFTLHSFDYSEALAGDSAQTITFTGNFVGGGSISQSVTSDGVFGFQKANFAGFTNLSSLTFTHGLFTGFQLDNIHLTAVPEPTSFLMFGTVLLADARRRRIA